MRWTVLFLALVAGCAGHERLRQDDPRVSEAEVIEARESDDPTLTPHLHRIVLERERYAPEVVVAALGALAARKDPASAPVVARLEHDPDEEVRFHTALTLRALGGREAAEVLARMAADDESPLVRAEAAAP
ncbi:MAG: HEAT repeat domain-containing protein [Planctomycetes bacterium]|nr:HEAT repeat domain-containing protein [Planctomycetota bacterium]